MSGTAWFIYLVVNNLNGKKYVGVTGRSVEKRMREHQIVAQSGRYNGAFHKAIRKYGWESFSFSVIRVCYTRKSAMASEIEIIDRIKPEYNSTKGGDGNLGRSMSPEARKRIALKHAGNKYRLGATHTDEIKSLLRKKAFENIETWMKYQSLGPKVCARKVLCVDTGEVFTSASEAARVLNVATSALIELCLGKRGRKSVGGMRFEYVA